MVRTDPLDVFLVVTALFKNEAAEVLGEDKGGVVARGEQAAVEELLHGEHVPLL